MDLQKDKANLQDIEGIVKEEFIARTKSLEELSEAEGYSDDLEVDLFLRYAVLGDIKKAYAHLSRGYEKGFLSFETRRKEYALVFAYLNLLGVGCKKDEKLAFTIINNAHELGDNIQSEGKVQYHLGMCYEYGVGVEQDLTSALERYIAADECSLQKAPTHRVYFLRATRFTAGPAIELMMAIQNFVPEVLSKIDEYRKIIHAGDNTTEDEGIKHLRELFANFQD